MSRTLAVHNRQRAFSLNRRLLTQIVESALVDLLRVDGFTVEIHVLGAGEMTQLNETFLGHPGVTDVITFDYAEPSGAHPLHGEIFVCVPVARTQAGQFRTTWQSELVRYMVHGILHLLGFDDHHPADRRRMKQRENRMVRALQARFNLRAIGTIN